MKINTVPANIVYILCKAATRHSVGPSNGIKNNIVLVICAVAALLSSGRRLIQESISFQIIRDDSGTS